MARVVRTLAIGSAAALLIAGCAQNAKETPKTSSEPKASAGASSAAPVEITPDEAPAVPAEVVLPAGDGKGKCAANTTLAYIGTIAGGNPALGRAIYQGAELALEEHNKANPGCQVKWRKFDSEGDPDKVIGPVNSAIADKNILGVVGLPFSGETKAAGPRFNASGLVTVTPSATNPALATKGWKTFFRALGNDAVQGPAIAKFLSEELKAKTVCIVKDDQEYSLGLADEVKKTLGDKVTCEVDVKKGQKEFSSVADEVATAKADAIFYSGYYDEASPFVRTLRDKGVKTPLVAPDGVRDQEFVKNAGPASEGTYLSCPCLPSVGFKAFYDAYKAKFNMEPSTYSPEAYDAMTILLQGVDKGLKTRDELREFVKAYKGQGLTKYFEFDQNGEVKEVPVWIYVVKDQQITHIKDVTVK